MPQTNDATVVHHLAQPWHRLCELRTEIAELDRILLLNDDLIVHHDTAIVALESARKRRADELEVLAWQLGPLSEPQ